VLKHKDCMIYFMNLEHATCQLSIGGQKEQGEKMNL